MPRLALQLSLCITLLTSLGTGGCQASGNGADKMPVRMSQSSASTLIGKALPATFYSDDAPPDVRETTPEGLFEALATQTFRLESGDRVNDTWAVTSTGETAALGTGYRGPGVVAFHLGDFDGNDTPELAYAFGSGPGITRYEVGIYDRPGDPLRSSPRTRRVPLSYRNPLIFRGVAGGLEVWDANRDEKVGLITAAGDELRFTPSSPLSQGVRERLLEPRLR